MIRRFALIALAAFLAACSKDHNDPVARGKAYFDSYQCSTCHRVGAAGAHLGPDLTLVGYRKSPEFLDTWLKNPQKWKASVSMPNFQFQDSVRKDLVAYLSSLKGQDYGGKRPWDGHEGVEKGRLIYMHAGCVTCHNVGGKGGYPNNNVVGGEIPVISGVKSTYSKSELLEKLHMGVPSPAKKDLSAESPLLYMPSWGKDGMLTEEELEAVVEYLFSLGGTAAAGDEW